MLFSPLPNPPIPIPQHPRSPLLPHTGNRLGFLWYDSPQSPLELLPLVRRANISRPTFRQSAAVSLPCRVELTRESPASRDRLCASVFVCVLVPVCVCECVHAGECYYCVIYIETSAHQNKVDIVRNYRSFSTHALTYSHHKRPRAAPRLGAPARRAYITIPRYLGRPARLERVYVFAPRPPPPHNYKNRQHKVCVCVREESSLGRVCVCACTCVCT